MTKKQLKKAYKLLIGRNVTNEICIFSFFALTVICAFILFLLGLSKEEILPSILFICSINIVYLILIFAHFMHCRLLKEKYEQLPEFQKEQLLELAGNYSYKHGVEFNSDFIYGGMSMSRSSRIKLFNMISFTYIPISDLTWVYKTETSMVYSSTYFGNISTPLATPNDDRIFMYTYDGKCYRGFSKNIDITKLSHAISSKNSSCILGYSKEKEKKFKSFN